MCVTKTIPEIVLTNIAGFKVTGQKGSDIGKLKLSASISYQNYTFSFSLRASEQHMQPPVQSLAEGPANSLFF